MERFADLEHHYEEDIHEMQDHYDETYYHKEEAEAEAKRLPLELSQHGEL